MKGMKGRFLRKLSFFPTISTLKQGLVLQLHPPPAYNTTNDPQQVGVEDRTSTTQHVKCLKNHEEVNLETKIIKESTNSDAESDDLPFLDALEEPEPEPELEPESKEGNEVEETLCPPGGSESVIFYTTSFRSIRKTYEDCNTIRLLLESLGVMFYERDVSMHLEFREELWRVLGGCKVIPPRLFIKGKHIGGAEEVVKLHEQGKLKELLNGLPLDPSNRPCIGCGNMRFVVCPNCHGSCKIVAQEESTRCPHCNENGLAKCPICRNCRYKDQIK